MGAQPASAAAPTRSGAMIENDVFMRRPQRRLVPLDVRAQRAHPLAGCSRGTSRRDQEFTASSCWSAALHTSASASERSRSLAGSAIAATHDLWTYASLV